MSAASENKSTIKRDISTGEDCIGIYACPISIRFATREEANLAEKQLCVLSFAEIGIHSASKYMANRGGNKVDETTACNGFELTIDNNPSRGGRLLLIQPRDGSGKLISIKFRTQDDAIAAKEILSTAVEMLMKPV
jgi:hypothetical protein